MSGKNKLHVLCLRTTLRGGVDVVFCSNQSADSWLIHEVDRLQKEGKAPQVSFEACVESRLKEYSVQMLTCC